MDKPSIYTALYAELLRIRREIRRIIAERERLDAMRETLADEEAAIHNIMTDYGYFAKETYKPTEEELNA